MSNDVVLDTDVALGTDLEASMTNLIGFVCNSKGSAGKAIINYNDDL